jgi:hypothetical protein
LERNLLRAIRVNVRLTRRKLLRIVMICLRLVVIRIVLRR